MSTRVAQRFESYESWMEAQVTQSIIDDQRRYAPVTAPVTKHYADETGRVLLGERSIADAQYAADEAQGGLVALLMNRGR